MPPATEKDDFDLGPLVRTDETGLEFSAARELRDWVDRLVEEMAAAKE